MLLQRYGFLEFSFFLSAVDSAALSFLLSSESLAILSNRYFSTVCQPPDDLSATLIILFLVSKPAITFLMPFNYFLVKLIWWVIDSSCAMIESLKSSWLPLYFSLCGSVLIFLANLSFSFRASLNFESKLLLRSWNNLFCSPLRMHTSLSSRIYLVSSLFC